MDNELRFFPFLQTMCCRLNEGQYALLPIKSAEHAYYCWSTCAVIGNPVTQVIVTLRS